MPNVSVVELYGKVYVGVDDLVNICQQQGRKIKFNTVSAQGFIQALTAVLEDSKTERFVLNSYNDSEITNFLEALRAKSDMNKFLGNKPAISREAE
ncbi:MAG: hypothetical protein ACW98W_19935 [Candidatus Hodarchaeales archaeon]|jgi:hypothetical protein